MELLEHISEKFATHHGGSERIESAKDKAQRIVEEEVGWRGWSEAELERRREADAEKTKMTRRLRAETMMTWGWMAERLAMGTSVTRHTACARPTVFARYAPFTLRRHNSNLWPREAEDRLQ